MSQPASSSPAKSNALGWMAAVSLLLLALLLRLWGITQESAWWDEYSSLMHLNRGSLFEFLSYNRTLDPATLPLYYAIEYLWSRLAGAGTFDLRIPSLLMGLALIPAVFALGRRCFNPAAGWVAALCVALSPIHIFHAQGIRMYVLFTLLAALSMLAYVGLRDGAGKRWWAIHLLVQFLLSWTHPFALLLPLVQGVAWLPRAARGDWRRLLLWAALVLLCWLPVLAYLATVEYWPEDSTASWFPAPTLTGVLADLFADDVISATYQLRVSAGAWEWLPVLGPLLLSARPAFDLALAAALLAAFVLAAVACFRAPRFLPSPRRDHLALLLLWVVLPVLVLYIGSLVLRPMIFPRYTVHASLALYLLAGALIGALPQAASRYLATAVLAALFAYQIVLTHPGPQRANYAGVADAIDHAASSRTDIVLVRGELWRDVFAYNAQTLDIPIISAEDDSLCALAASHYLGAAPEAATVWLVAPDDYFDSQPESDLESALKAEGLTCEPARYFGIRDLYLYTVRGKGSVAPRPALVKLAQQQSDAEEKRTLLRTIAGTAASLAARGKSTDAYTLLRAYVGDAVDDDFLYGALAHTLREGIGEDDAYATSSSRPGGAAAAPPLSTFDTAMAVTESLGLLQQGHTALAASQLLVLAASSHAPAILTTELLDLAAAFPDDADRYISAAFAVAHPPKDLHYIGIQKAAEHPALASRHIDHVVKTPNPPHDLFFMFMQASVDYPALAETYVDGALAVPNPPENLYYHLIQAATSAAARVGCGPVLTKLLGAARPLAPLDFQISWSTLERRCKEGKDLREFLERKPRMDEGMAAFGEGRLDDARALLQQAMTEDFGMPRLMLAIIALMQGNRAEFDTAAPAALAADPDVDAVFGPVIRALVGRDRAAAIQAAEAFRGTDLDNADILLGIIDAALPQGV